MLALNSIYVTYAVARLHSAGGFFFFGVLQDKIRTGGSEQGRTLPSNTRTRIGQTLGIVSGHPDTLRMRRLAEAHLIAGWNSGLTCR